LGLEIQIQENLQIRPENLSKPWFEKPFGPFRICEKTSVLFKRTEIFSFVANELKFVVRPR
jgi:hypothetical protein